ncbi:hypothetical protein AVEN_89843-1 [Araneus ventricosus]|uniref:Uncharacterized protein n=1 Tax=Araneus ventricosus TaxID=182803 RepID=A0A4Y2SRX1_ARAVE|nr:hypothetical protein AVEN_89843-1 [Araneus ventricosus]
MAFQRILKALNVKRSAATTAIATNNIRISNLSNLPAFDLRAMDYVDLIKWYNVIEPPLTERFSDDMISEAIVNPAIIQEAILPTVKGFFCHTQATERIVKVVTEAAAAVCRPSRKDGFIKNRLKSRNLIPVFNTKHDYRPL